MQRGFWLKALGDTARSRLAATVVLSPSYAGSTAGTGVISMRRCKVQRGLIVITVTCVSSCLTAGGALAEKSPAPVSAKVITPGAAVHSGPGDNYYLTDTLPEGEMVEVYRRRDDGWCAIRPPADSFSWVFASNVQLDDEGLAKVTKDNAASRVGSRLSSHRDVVQVRLRKGETVKILGKDEQESETWYKIAPPAGEFRWVAANCLASAESADVGEAGASAVTRTSHDEPANAALDTKSWELMPPPLVSTANQPAQKTAASSASASSVPTNGSAAPATSAPAPKVATNAPAAIPASAAVDSTTTTAPKADISPIVAPTAASPETAKQLGDLELRLSQMVAEPPATWNIDALQQSAEQLLSKADTVGDRDAVKGTLAKIDRFGAIQRRSVAIGNGAAASGTTAGSISPSTITALPSVAQTAPVAAGANGGAVGGQFDAVGVLRPVVSRRPGAPQFALVDEKGQVVTFVTPTPDVNLQPYLGRRIGVVGSRGYIPEFHRAHVMAGRVTPLGDTVLR
jgi:uncharacterized protein YgiM (DUF1202 family)